MLTHWGQDKMAAWQHFEMEFLELKLINSDFIDFWFHWSLFLGSNKQYSHIDSENSLALARGQAIIWTNDGQFTNAYLCHSASMSEPWPTNISVWS